MPIFLSDGRYWKCAYVAYHCFWRIDRSDCHGPAQQVSPSILAQGAVRSHCVTDEIQDLHIGSEATD